MSIIYSSTVMKIANYLNLSAGVQGSGTKIMSSDYKNN